jgi:hypothetical protein
MAVRATSWFFVKLQAPVPPESYDLGVTIIGQKDMANWCWVACIKMALQQQGDTSLSLSQVVRKKYNCDQLSACDNPCPPDEVAGACQASGLSQANLAGPVDLATLKKQVGIRKNTVGVGWEGSPRHMVLVFGYEKVVNDVKVWVCDPAGSGSKALMTMDELASPKSSGSDRAWAWTWLDLRR